MEVVNVMYLIDKNISCAKQTFILNHTDELLTNFIYNILFFEKTQLEKGYMGACHKNLSFDFLNNFEIDIPKDKSLIDNLQPTFDKIELLQKESTEAKELYENLLVELKKDAIKEIRNTKGVIYPEPVVSNDDEPKSESEPNKEPSKKKPVSKKKIDSKEVLSDDFESKLDGLAKNKKKPYQEILDKYEIKYAKSATIQKLKELILKNKEEKNIQIE